MTYLGIDLGTSGLRALLIDESGDFHASAEQRYSTDHPHSGWSEQDPKHWTDTASGVMDALRDEYPKEVAAIKGIGVSGHMHGATLLDKNGTVLRPCILWNDTRAYEEAQLLDSIAEVRGLSGNIVFPGFTAPKLLWVRKNEPELFAQIDKVLLPAAYLNFWLTGETFADMSDSAGTSWLDTGRRAWSDYLLSAGDMRADQMPRLVEGCETGGTLRKELCADWGIATPPVVVGGAGDNAAAAAGIGALNDGQGFVSLGTSGVLMVARDSYAPAPETAVHTFCHAVPDRWYQMGVILAATDSLNWLSNVLEAEPAALTMLLGDNLKSPSSTRFLPYISGERTPHNDSAIRGAFLNLSVGTDRSEMVQAVLEGVSFALADCKDALAKTNASFETVFAIGGGAQSRYWVELLATVLDLPLAIPKSGEFGAAMGAARLAMIGATSADPHDILRSPEISEKIEPNTKLKGAFAAAHHAYRDSYKYLRDMP